MESSVYRFVISPRTSHEPLYPRLLADAHALGFPEVNSFVCQELYFIQGKLTEDEQTVLINKLLCDPVTQYWQNENNEKNQTQVVEVILRPGVTDPVAEELIKRCHQIGIKGVKQAATGRRYLIQSAKSLNQDQLKLLAQRLLANSVIHDYAIGKIKALFIPVEAKTPPVNMIPIRSLNDEQLLNLSQERRTALDIYEMKAIQKYFQQVERDPTDVELEMIAQTWSEHCSHKTFRATINYEGQVVNGLLKTYIKAATDKINASWVHSAFVDNAGIIEFDNQYQVAFKVETHNHPSAIEPFGGANTGLGGVIRDVLGVSAKPIAATDVFCFGPTDIPVEHLPTGTLHPRLIRTGVVAGVEDYGNKTGIPTVNGAVYYDIGYVANPLVFCGCIGLIPTNKHPRQPQPGDRIIVLGGRTGRDGLRGATFSSMTMDAQTGEVAGASVQIGDPIIAKGLIEVVTRARDKQLYHAITDCGAGGLSSAVGEMGSELGAEVDLDKVPLKYPGLAPWEIWLSEAQERMVLAVPSSNINMLQNICDEFDVELTDIGTFTSNQRILVRYGTHIVLDLKNHFLFEGMPAKQFLAKKPNSSIAFKDHHQKQLQAIQTSPENYLLTLLSHPNIASKENIIRLYDHEIQGGTVIKPLMGIAADAPSDACVLKPQGTEGLRGIVISNGINPEIGKYDPYLMAVSAIDEAVRNAVAVGANPTRIAILDNFCWGDPRRAETLGALIETTRGCYDAALHYQTPFISGKDSLNNEYTDAAGQRHAIPGTLLISALGIIEDITCAVSMDLKKPGNSIYLLGKPYMGLPSYAPALYQSLHEAMLKKLVRSCHDVSEGGIALALAEMCIGGRLGCRIEWPTSEVKEDLFKEGNGCLIVEVEPDKEKLFKAIFKDELKPLILSLGHVTEKPELKINQVSNTYLSLSVEKLTNAFHGKNYET